ncbi:MAG: type II secretion system minor pseudopilin GspI [Thioalkalispiraceae bacterium]|jgi:general secretion pathway protein I
MMFSVNRQSWLKPNARGFTLLEVLVAMVILSLSLMAAIKVASEVTTSAIYLQDKTIAQWVAMNKVTEMRLVKKLPEIGRSNGEDEMAGRSWRWDILVKKTAYPTLREVEIGVKPASEDSDAPPTVVVISLLGEL